jgi:hypothetical protein
MDAPGPPRTGLALVANKHRRSRVRKCAGSEKTARHLFDDAPQGDGEYQKERLGGTALRGAAESPIERCGNPWCSKFGANHEPHQRAEIVHRG